MKKFTTIILISLIGILNLSNKCLGQYTKLHDFPFSSGGAGEDFSLISVGTFLYGLNDDIFKIKPDGTGYVQVYGFAGGLNGAGPVGSLVSDGTFLFGFAAFGGASNNGVIFKIKPDGTGYTAYDFGHNADGELQSSPFFDGTYLYGMTYGGGANNKGVIFKIKPDGTAYSKLLDFDGTNGSYPNGSLMSDGIFLYGMTNQGGANNMGVVFKIKPDGTGYSDILDFSGSTNGSYPRGNLFYDGSFLYGMTAVGGANSNGVIFKIKTDGTGYSKLLDFAGTSNGNQPYGGGFISDGIFLYGSTPQGGTNSKGVLFKIKTDGTGFSKLIDFAGVSNGRAPRGTLISDGSTLYGTTSYGGDNDGGTIFKYALVTGISETNMETNFNVYPNPSNGIFTIETKENNYELIITNVIGEIVYQSKKQQSKIDLCNKPKGIYFLQVIDEKKNVLNKKIIID